MTWIPLRPELVAGLLESNELVKQRRKNQMVYVFGSGFVGLLIEEHSRLCEIGGSDYKLAYTEGAGYRIFIGDSKVATMVKLQWG